MEKLNKITELKIQFNYWLIVKLIESNHESLKSMTENTKLISDLDEKTKEYEKTKKF